MTVEPDPISGEAFGDLDALAQRLTNGQFEITALSVLAPFLPSLTMGWAVLNIAMANGGFGAPLSYLAAAIAAGLTLRLYIRTERMWQPVISVLVAIGGSAAIDGGVSAIAVPTGAGLVVASTLAATYLGERRPAGDHCLMFVPLCVCAVIAAVAGRISGWDVYRLTGAVALAAFALVAARQATGNLKISSLALRCLAFGGLFVVYGWAWTRLALIASAGAVVTCILLLAAYHSVTRSLVERAVTRELVSAVRSTSNRIYDDLHEVVLNRLGVARTLTQQGRLHDAEEAIAKTEGEVRAFRAIELAPPTRRVDEVLSAVARSYRPIVEVSLPERPSATAITMSAADARHFRWVISELIGNAARHARGIDGKARMTVESGVLNGSLHVHMWDDGPGISAIPERGVLANVFAETNSRPNWAIELLDTRPGAHFSLTVHTGSR